PSGARSSPMLPVSSPSSTALSITPRFSPSMVDPTASKKPKNAPNSGHASAAEASHDSFSFNPTAPHHPGSTRGDHRAARRRRESALASTTRGWRRECIVGHQIPQALVIMHKLKRLLLAHDDAMVGLGLMVRPHLPELDFDFLANVRDAELLRANRL